MNRMEWNQLLNDLRLEYKRNGKLSKVSREKLNEGKKIGDKFYTYRLFYTNVYELFRLFFNS